MTIDELGSLGELVVSIAVILTLIYLASQVRQGNVASLVQSNQAINKKYSDSMKALYTNQEVFDVWARGKASYSTLSEQDATKFQLIRYDAFGIWHLAFGIWHLAYGDWQLARTMVSIPLRGY